MNLSPTQPLAGEDYEGQNWDQVDFTDGDLSRTSFTNCQFTACDFSRLVLASTRFEACRFVDCNLSNTVIDHTRFDDVVFEGCKLVGLNFGSADPLVFGLELHRCLLRYVNFSQLRWKKAVVVDCDAHDSDFRSARLEGADFRKTRFRACRFSGADLTRADFSFCEGYDLDLRTEVLKKAVFTMPEALNLLAPFDLDIR